MNNSKYNDLLEKYYSGLTTAEEERWLRAHAQPGQEPLPLSSFSTGADEMSWSFGEFLAQAKQKQDNVAKAPLYFMRRARYAAAVMAIALLAIGLYTVNNRPAETATNPPEGKAITMVADNDNNASAIKIADTLQGSVSPTQKAIAYRKPVRTRKRPVQIQPAMPQKNDDFFVMVNGKRITDENEALAVLQQSFRSMSGDVKETMAGINNSPKLDVKFK
ncbi:MAG: hypothetical protein QM687_06385 [Ferruginibacter sp.]